MKKVQPSIFNIKYIMQTETKNLPKFRRLLKKYKMNIMANI